MPRLATEVLDGQDLDLQPFYDGLVLLKFGRKGPAHEKKISLSKDNRTISWKAAILCWKFGASCSVDLETVVRIQKGQSTAPFQRQEKYFKSAVLNSLSLIYIDEHRNERSLDLIAPNQHVFAYLIDTLTALIKSIKYMFDSMSIDIRYFKKQWEIADREQRATLTRRQIIEIAESMNVSKPISLLSDIFDLVDEEKSGLLDFEGFCEFMRFVQRRFDLEHIWIHLVQSRIENITANVVNNFPIPNIEYDLMVIT